MSATAARPRRRPAEKGTLLPVFTGPEMAAALTAYRELQQALDARCPTRSSTLDGKPFRKKGYWRAVAVAFNLTVEPVEERREVHGDAFVYVVTYRASTASGRAAIGDGACGSDEKSRGRMRATEHNVRSHAHTRAYNRAVSNLVGFGEVSAEEVDRDDAAGAGGARRPAADRRTIEAGDPPAGYRQVAAHADGRRGPRHRAAAPGLERLAARVSAAAHQDEPGGLGRAQGGRRRAGSRLRAAVAGVAPGAAREAHRLPRRGGVAWSARRVGRPADPPHELVRERITGRSHESRLQQRAHGARRAVRAGGVRRLRGGDGAPGRPGRLPGARRARGRLFARRPGSATRGCSRSSARRRTSTSKRWSRREDAGGVSPRRSRTACG